MPIFPIIRQDIMKSRRYQRNPFVISGSVKIRADRDVMAMTIIMIGDTIPAFTAASPRIKAPTFDNALVVKVGLRRSHSLRISKDGTVAL